MTEPPNAAQNLDRPAGEYAESMRSTAANRGAEQVKSIRIPQKRIGRPSNTPEQRTAAVAQTLANARVLRKLAAAQRELQKVQDQRKEKQR